MEDKDVLDAMAQGLIARGYTVTPPAGGKLKPPPTTSPDRPGWRTSVHFVLKANDDPIKELSSILGINYGDMGEFLAGGFVRVEYQPIEGESVHVNVAFNLMPLDHTLKPSLSRDAVRDEHSRAIEEGKKRKQMFTAPAAPVFNPFLRSAYPVASKLLKIDTE